MNEIKNNFVVGNYGLVKIVNGKLKGRFAFYDDDDCERDAAIIYMGNMLLNSKYYTIPYKNLSNNYTNDELNKRIQEINKELFYTDKIKKRNLLLEEKNLLEQYLCSRNY